MGDKLNLVIEAFDGISVTVRLSRPYDVGSSDERILVAQLRDLPQINYNGSMSTWTFPLNSNSAVHIRDKWPQAEWVTEQGEAAYKLVLSLEESVERRSEMIGRFMAAARDSNGVLPLDAIPSPPKGHVFKRMPMAHQLVGLECVRTSPFLGLFMEMGTGKTKVISDLLDYTAQHSKLDHPLRVLIVCPKSVMINWARELKTDVSCQYRVAMMCWTSATTRRTLRDFNLVASKGGDFGGVETLLELVRCQDVAMQVMLVNYDNVKGRLPLLKGAKFDVCILDEAHRIKSFKAKRTKAILDLALSCGRRYILTGTPLTQNPMDLFPQFEFMGPGMGLLGYSSFYAYENAYSEKSSWGKTTSWKNTGKLLQLASKWAFSVKKKDCLDLPEKTFETRNIEMTPAQQDMYNKVATEVLLVLESLGTEVTIQNILVQYLRLAQVTSGYIKTADGREVNIEKGEVKIDELMEVLEETNGQKVVVWSRFVHEIEAVCARLEKAGVGHVKYYGAISDDERQQAVDRFQNDPTVKVFVGNAAAGGLGINLTAGSVVVYLSNSFSLADRLQSEDRTHRIGQKNSVTYIDMACEDSIDELVIERLAKKREMADLFTNPVEMLSSLKDFLVGTIRK